MRGKKKEKKKKKEGKKKTEKTSGCVGGQGWKGSPRFLYRWKGDGRVEEKPRRQTTTRSASRSKRCFATESRLGGRGGKVPLEKRRGQETKRGREGFSTGKPALTRSALSERKKGFIFPGEEGC